MCAARVEYRLLGPLDVVVDGHSIGLVGPRVQATLAGLLLHADHTVSIDALVTLLWGAEPPSTARRQVQNCVGRLRRLLADEGLAASIETRPAGYRLRLGHDELDLLVFERQVQQAHGSASDGNLAEAADALRAAFGLWRGSPLQGLTGAGIEAEALRLEERRLGVLEECLDLELALGRHHHLIGELTSLVATHPFREKLRAQLMLALYRSSRQADALAVYQEGRRALVEELGLDPGPELNRLEQAILARDPSLDQAPPRARTDTAIRPAQLPPAIADFTGRSGHVSRLEAALRADDRSASPAVVISAVAGRGGVGKTALAVHVAHQLADRFPDGQLYVNLRGVQAEPLDVSRALGRFLRALGVDGSTIPDDLDERAELYRSRIAGRRCLVVLDNAASEAQVRPLLPGTPSCGVLVTSRQRLSGLEGAQPVDLDVFEPDQARELLAKIAGPDRVAAEPEAAGAVARLCGYLPLAVRIAGARLATRPDWSIARLAERLSDERRRLDELAAGDLEVRASIELSYLSLDDKSQQTLRRLALLDAPDVASWVAAAVLDTTVESAAELVDNLVDARLLDVAGTDVAGHSRYRLHDLIRLYARERSADEDTEEQRTATLTRAIAAWMALAERADGDMRNQDLATVHGDAPRWSLDEPTVASLLADPLTWFETERVALVASITQATALGFDELAWELAASCRWFFDRRHLLDDWKHTHRVALSACREANNERGRAVIARNLACLANSSTFVRDFTWLAACADEAVATSRAIGDRRLEVDSLIQWGQRHRHDDPASAVEHLKAALQLADADGYAFGSTFGRFWLGIVHRESGQFGEAMRCAELCLDLARRHDRRDQQVEALRLLGVLHLEHGAYHESEEAFTQALRFARDIGDQQKETRALAQLGELYVQWGRAEARPTLEQALELSSQRGDDFGGAAAHRSLGELALVEQHHDEALAHLQAALEHYRQDRFAYMEAQTLRALGNIHAARGDAHSARTAWDEARRLFQQLGNTAKADALTKRIRESDR